MMAATRELALWHWVTEDMNCTLVNDANCGSDQPWCVVDIDNQVVSRGTTPVWAIENLRAQLGVVL